MAGGYPSPGSSGHPAGRYFFHQPYGTFDFTGQQGKFIRHPGAALDLFFVGSADPATIMAEYCGPHGFRGDATAGKFGINNPSHRLPVERKYLRAKTSVKEDLHAMP